MGRTTTVVVGVMTLAAGSLPGQEASDTARRVLALHSIIERHGPMIGPAIWPGFRPDTIPTLYVIAHRGKVLVQWRHDWPEGFAPLNGIAQAGTAGTQMVSLPHGRFISFMSVDSSMSPGLVVGTSIHEAFHSYERSVMREGTRFGAGENAMLVGTYPVFDVENEAAFALEGRKLRQALDAPSADAAKRMAREFLALRERRQRTLDSEFTEFEKMAEMNEGLAQYALLRGLSEVGRLEGGEWVAAARHEAAIEASLLDSLLQLSRRSVRRRFYATGSAIALLLDRLAGPSWKARLLSENLNLQEVLSVVTGHDSLAEPSLVAADRELARLMPEASRSVGRLRVQRAGQADSILNQPGIRLELDPAALDSGTLQWCGFDPQNTLQTGDGRTIHMRFLQVCAGSNAKAEFDQAVVQEDSTGTLRTVVEVAELKLTGENGALVVAEGESVEVRRLQLDGRAIHVGARRVRVTRRGNRLTLSLLVEGR
jgi:hypothetical protein